MTAAIARDAIYRRRRFQPEIIELCVRWYPTYRLSYRDLVEMMAERGVTIYNNIVEQDHRAVKRRCAPMLALKSFRTAAVTLAGVELAHRIRKGQFSFGSDTAELRLLQPSELQARGVPVCHGSYPRQRGEDGCPIREARRVAAAPDLPMFAKG